MNKKTDKVNCTDIEWIGRAHCEECHIRQVMLFSELPESAFKNSLQPIDNFLYPPGSVLYEAGVGDNFIYSIRRGIIKLVHISHDGSYRIVRLLSAGTAIGLELLEGAASYSHTAIAVNEVDLCKIPVSTIKHLEEKYPKLLNQVGKRLQNQLNVADQWIIALGTGTAKQRVAQLLLLLHHHYSDHQGAFVLLSRDDMSGMTGITVETVSRIVAEFKRNETLYKLSDGHHRCNATTLQNITEHD